MPAGVRTVYYHYRPHNGTWLVKSRSLGPDDEIGDDVSSTLVDSGVKGI